MVNTIEGGGIWLGATKWFGKVINTDGSPLSRWVLQAGKELQLDIISFMDFFSYFFFQLYGKLGIRIDCHAKT